MQVLKEVKLQTSTPKEDTKKVKPMKEQILNLTEKEELAVLQAAKQIKKRKIAEKNKALAETLAKSYRGKGKRRYLAHDS